MQKTTSPASAAGANVIPQPIGKSDITLALPERPGSPRLPRNTKSTLLLKMLLQPAGASLRCIMAATGWQAHTVRAALSGLRKSGVEIIRMTQDAETFYTAVAQAYPTAKTEDGHGPAPGGEDTKLAVSTVRATFSVAALDAPNPEMQL